MFKCYQRNDARKTFKGGKMKNTMITVLIILVIIISTVSYNKINALKSENSAMTERLDKLTYKGNVNMGPDKAGELMDELFSRYDTEVYLTSAYFRPNIEVSPMRGYCISFKDWKGEKVCTSNLNETLDTDYHDYVTKILNEKKISDKLGDLMKKKNLTDGEIVEGIK